MIIPTGTLDLLRLSSKLCIRQISVSRGLKLRAQTIAYPRVPLLGGPNLSGWFKNIMKTI
jgi:hypothetical protein